MIDARTLQEWLAKKGPYAGKVDGIAGPHTMMAVDAVLASMGIGDETWTDERKWRAVEQVFLEEQGFDVGTVDGYYGPKTDAAHDAWIASQVDADPPDAAVVHQKAIWPRQADVPAFYGEVGKNQVMVTPPYQLYYDKQRISRISLHEKVADSAARVLYTVLAHYGPDRIHELGLDIYAGSLNVRPMRGGTRPSMHSWGIAIDWDPANNALKMDHTKARFAKPEYAPWWDIWEAEGWISLGRERDFDWMHVQAARL